MKIGSHVGMSGKEMMLGSVKEALSYDANTFMLYTGAPQNTRRKDVSELRVEEAWELMRANDITEFVVHAPYIINLANTVKPEIYQLAVDFLKTEINRTAAMGSKTLVLHPGSHVNVGVDAGIDSIIKGLNEVLTQDTPVHIALETMAGKGSEIGGKFEELREIIDYAKKPFIIKGIMTVRGAQKALEAGASAIVVSNHGGRVQDQCPSTAEVLPAIADAVGGKLTILVDGGLRNGTDIFKALALGADGVLIGRPFVTMVYGGGAQGPGVLVKKLQAELADTMAMCGAHSLAEIRRDMLFGY